MGIKAVNELNALRSSLPGESTDIPPEQAVIIRTVIQSCKSHINSGESLKEKVSILDARLDRRLHFLRPSPDDKKTLDTLLGKVRSTKDSFSSKVKDLEEQLGLLERRVDKSFVPSGLKKTDQDN